MGDEESGRQDIYYKVASEISNTMRVGLECWSCAIYIAYKILSPGTNTKTEMVLARPLMARYIDFLREGVYDETARLTRIQY